MPGYVPEDVEAYAERYTSAGWEGFGRLAEETRATQSAPQMMVGDVEGTFLSFLVTMTGAERIVIATRNPRKAPSTSPTIICGALCVALVSSASRPKPSQPAVVYRSE